MQSLALLGPSGWGPALLLAAATTIALALCGFLVGAAIGALAACAKLAGPAPLAGLAGLYTTILRGVPDLLVIYLLYFGGSAALGSVAGLFGATGFVGLPPFAVGVGALGIISGAYQAEVFRGAYLALDRGLIEAARAVGMSPALLFRRVVAPLVARTALPGLGNVWQILLKDSALVSVTGLVELLRQAQVGAGSTRQPFTFYLAAGALYLLITSLSSWGFARAEAHARRGTP
ncbi:polar amino acid ABC transporter, inner membrane subunit [Methylobacterium sp. 4-46]|uniref:ABC transporter permease n=1 Tax=unclassified Methylobacterium TaxID=2615210 RepID=UPI000165CD47|nr:MULTISPECIES: ABC transporter permease subunit [Methylobacterium]ACA18827.1 polar amino acid ABC transporter, inner membrane subunit [Methylobacterium sp. 4-46]WFT78053.1 ABC transporter permease subunit [Methylobacterium nodulans]